MSQSRSSTPEGGHKQGEVVLNSTTSPRTLIRVAREFQLEKNKAEEELRSLRRKFEEVNREEDDDEIVNDQDSCRRKRHRRVEGSQTDSSNNPGDRNDEDDDENAVFQAGHLFLMVCGPWLKRGEKTFDVLLDDDYEEKERFENAHNKLQGQLHDIRVVLPERYHHDLVEAKWVAKTFIQGMNAQRSNTASRLRHRCAPIFQVDLLDMLDSAKRGERFRERIGWVTNDQGRGSYSSVDVEIIHKDSSREYNYQTAFLNPVLMQVFVAIIRGPNAAIKLKQGGLSCPKTETMENKHRIKNTTPGAIATTTILTRWALSADDCLQERGSITGIDWMGDYEEYLEILTVGLRRKKKSIINIFREWDRTIFPHTDASLVPGVADTEKSGLKKALDMLDGDSEDDSGKEGEVRGIVTSM